MLLSITTVNSSAGTVAELPLISSELKGSRALGQPDAKVVVEIFSDFQCGHCAELHRSIESEIIRRYVATGQVLLKAHQVAFLGSASGKATEAALCADDQGRFWEYRDALYSRAARSGKIAFKPASLIILAKELGLNEEAFATCLTQNAYAHTVSSDTDRLLQAGVESVPTTLINGRKIVGVWPLAEYLAIIDEELAR